ncbi:MAG: type II toxin-antitoxin system MqsA family antitoxin [Ruminococcus sp.]|nr:type II toxin-antitoxin system MqsA family antitoxin [Ruminococcus sp.]
MKCFFCKSDMDESVPVHTAELKNCIVIIKNVPCMKCSECGETVYSGETLQRIEEILERCKRAMTEVAIVNYTDTAA